jgi:hypothetical protein
MPLEGAREPANARPVRGCARLSAPALATLAALALTACQRDPVAHYRVPKSQVPAADAMPPGGGMAAPGSDMAGGAAAVPPPPQVEGGLRWTLPSGWKETRGGGQMRYATLTAPVTGKVDVSVIVLPGPAGGELANVNRWRNQIGLPPLAEGDLPANRKPLRTKAGELSVYDFSSDGTKKTRTIAGLTSADGNTWFVKMTGDAEAVASASPAFLELLGSLRLEDR